MVPAAGHFAASPESVGVDSGRLEALFERATREVCEGRLPSCQIALARHGKIAGMRSLGRVLHQGRPAEASDETLYLIFSCTKAITSAAAWLLIQEGKLGLGERVADAIPEFATNGKESVLVEQLFTHAAGFPYAPFPQREWTQPGARLRRFSQWRLDWEPGSRFEYHATSGMWVLAELIERRSGLDFRDFVRQRISEPLGLDGLFLGLPAALQGRLADLELVGSPPSRQELARLGLEELPAGEVTDEAVLGFNESSVREAGAPGGGGSTTAGDLALFYQALIDGRGPDGRQIWTPEMLRDVRRVRNPDFVDPLFGKPANRGLGIVVAGPEDQRIFTGFGRKGSADSFGHGGAGGQIGWADPVSGISVAYFTNGYDRNRLRWARRSVAISSRAAVCAAD